MASSTPPARAAAPAHSGATGRYSTAMGQVASHCSRAARGCRLHSAKFHSGTQSTPPSASGVTTSVTHGIATRLATKPTSDTWPNSSRESGVSASVTTHCSRSNASTRARPLGGAPPTARVSVANSTATATKLSQKPAWYSAHGSTQTTAAQASSQTWGQGQRRPESCSRATVASMVTVRCAGTPQPLKRA